MKGATLKIVSLGKTFEGKTGGVEALRDINLTTREGEFLTIVGPSGCGKSTLLSLVAGLEEPTTGWVEMDGKRVDGPGPDRVVVFQESALFPWLDVHGNVQFGLRVAGLPRDEREARVAEFIKMVQLENFTHARIHELSGGMKQRVGLARALVLRPKVLLMDEPFAALDVQIREEMQVVVQDLWLRNLTTTLFVTHDVREAAVLGDRIIVLSHRPGTVSAILRNDAPRPRTVNDPTIVDRIQRANEILKAEVQWANHHPL
ncbi:MAG TPA: ABC transporter ATP-binding protein [Thermoplasmata archaeon]